MLFSEYLKDVCKIDVKNNIKYVLDHLQKHKKMDVYLNRICKSNMTILYIKYLDYCIEHGKHDFDKN